MNYSIVTPVKNEKGNVEKTIESVISQTILPYEWIIVNDGSKDGTAEILNEAEKKYDWIRVINAEEFNITDYSCRVVHLFNLGYSQIKVQPEFISKLDADVQFDPTFYEVLISAFVKNPKLGIASGLLTINGIPEEKQIPPYLCTRGATKLYRKTCLENIGGIILFNGWDSMDNVAARAKGWEVDIIPVHFEHLKEEGSKVGSKYYYHFRTGVYNGRIPYLFPYFIIKVLSKITERPYIITSILQILGFIKGRLNKNHPYPAYMITQLHKEQKQTLIKLLFRK
jgi:biofilm PGA synthesis N-glycosyltransferase PgaC